ncbi:MAG: hypothetical protein VSS75_025265 [Candidatus Parabeggiatoa sp.]|nr:hypothetical protein [Candidatus Parabeggiatoa sp.]
MENREIYSLLDNFFNIRELSNNKDKYDWQAIMSALSNYQKWLSEIAKTFPGKQEYSDEHIAEQIFEKEQPQQEKIFYKYHVFAIVECVKKIENELTKIQKKGVAVDDRYVKGNLALLKDIVIDSYEFIGQYEENILKEDATHKIRRQRNFASDDIFFCSQNLLKRHFYYNDITFSSIPIFLIRQSIETKILKSLGIGLILNSSGKPAKYKFEQIVEFVFQSRYVKLPIKKSVLLKIFQWSNYYIHYGTMYYHWEIMWAHRILQPLFEGGKGKSMIKLYGSIKIDKEYFERQFEVDFLKHLDIENGKITKSSPEAIVE